MIDILINSIVASLPPEVKGSLNKVNEFMPVVSAYHASVPLEKSKGELGVGYLLRFEDMRNAKNEPETHIILYQVILASTPEFPKPHVSRQLGKWDINEKIEEIKKAG